MASIVVKLDRAAVFLADNGYPYWDAEEDSDIPPGFAILQAQAALVLGTSGVEQLSKREGAEAWGLIAEAWSLGLQGHPAEARRVIRVAGRLTRQRLTAKARAWVIQSALFGLVLAGALLFTAWQVLRARHDSSYSAVLLGMIGGGFSLLSRYNKLPVDPGAGRGAHYWETAARLAVGATAGYVAQLALHADLALTVLGGTEWGMLLAFFVAGSSERLVPSLVRSHDADDAMPKATIKVKTEIEHGSNKEEEGKKVGAQESASGEEKADQEESG